VVPVLPPTGVTAVGSLNPSLGPSPISSVNVAAAIAVLRITHELNAVIIDNMFLFVFILAPLLD